MYTINQMDYKEEIDKMIEEHEQIIRCSKEMNNVFESKCHEFDLLLCKRLIRDVDKKNEMIKNTVDCDDKCFIFNTVIVPYALKLRCLYSLGIKDDEPLAQEIINEVFISGYAYDIFSKLDDFKIAY